MEPNSIGQLGRLLDAAIAAMSTRGSKDSDDLRLRVDEARERGWFAEQFGTFLGRMQEDPGYQPAGCSAGLWTWMRNATHSASWQLHGRPQTDTLLVGVPDALFVSPQATDHARIRTYGTDRPIRNDVFDADVRLVVQDEIAIDRFCIVQSKPEFGHAYEIVTDRPLALLKIELVQRQTFVWDFDRTSLAPRLLFPANVLAARRRLVLDFLQASNHAEIEAYATDLLDAEEYFLRWAGMQALAGRDPEKLRAVLERARADAHPEISAIAARIQGQTSAEPRGA